MEVLVPAQVAVDGAPAVDRTVAAQVAAAPTRRAYVMTDKPLYQPGETIWFRADVRRTATLRDDRPLGLTVTTTRVSLLGPAARLRH